MKDLSYLKVGGVGNLKWKSSFFFSGQFVNIRIFCKVDLFFN